MGVATETIRTSERFTSFENRVETETLLKAIDDAISSKNSNKKKIRSLTRFFVLDFEDLGYVGGLYKRQEMAAMKKCGEWKGKRVAKAGLPSVG